LNRSRSNNNPLLNPFFSHLLFNHCPHIHRFGAPLDGDRPQAPEYDIVADRDALAVGPLMRSNSQGIL